ncbi:type VI secretion system Vgr family protein [Bartonella sp. HY406]|uniref:type VI secretion system Vgr family protein n=1 Tax=Bartonella sp. HY406 TaxID=2979331 RepID=UPI0021C5B810|nr:type VI secretion system tip protein TssI/VgrG [Bartonella sp. HY406]UXN02963.1 type VI secretion system tip protein VgrG [Bartonella sp. HY406]
MSAMPILPKQFQEQDIAFSYWMKEAPNDTFVVTAFAVDEAIFGMTRIEVMLSSSDDNIDLQALLDSPGTLTIHHKYMETLRHFSGVVVEAERGDRGHHRTAYRLVLMPSLYRLDHGSDCRVFQTKKVGDIVKELFSEHGIENVTWDIDEGSHDAREYCVQYRESHLGFVERILAEEGIFYYFEHDKEGLLKLIISDKPNVLHDCPGLKEIEYNSLSSGSVKGLFCSSLSYREKLRATTVVQRDYTFKNPVYNQEHKERTANPNGEKHDYELYDYPGRYKKDSAGKAFTRYKLEATRVDASLGYGVSNAPHLLTGHAITLFEHPDDRLNQKWRLLTIRHEGVQPQAWGEDAQGIGMADTGIVAPGLHGTTLSGLSFGTTSSHSPNLLTQSLNRRMGLAVAGNNNASDNATVYANAFAVQPSHLPYRAPQTNKPLIDGPQIATVVGPEGEEIHTDQYGRVKVHFPWDRHKDPKAEDSSCWIRVSSNWAGAKWAHIAIPRIGHEVIVDFLEGDPDQPIITGRTYNAQNMPPYDLAKDKTRMTIKSKTHKGDGFNELRFEDDKGHEEYFMHAERDMNTKVKRSASRMVNLNNLVMIGHSSASEIGNHSTEVVGGDMALYVGPSQAGLLVPNHAMTLNEGIGNLTDTLGSPDATPQGVGNLKITVEKHRMINVGATSIEKVEEDKRLFVEKSYMQDVKEDVLIEAGQNIILKCGKSKITLSKDGTITINGIKLISNQKDSAEFYSDIIKIN